MLRFDGKVINVSILTKNLTYQNNNIWSLCLRQRLMRFCSTQRWDRPPFGLTIGLQSCRNQRIRIRKRLTILQNLPLQSGLDSRRINSHTQHLLNHSWTHQSLDFIIAWCPRILGDFRCQRLRRPLVQAFTDELVALDQPDESALEEPPGKGRILVIKTKTKEANFVAKRGP